MILYKKFVQLNFLPHICNANETNDKKYTVVVANKLFRGIVMPLPVNNKRIIT